MKRFLRRARNTLNKWLVQVQNEYLRNARVIGHPFQLTLESGNVQRIAANGSDVTLHNKADWPDDMVM